MVVIYIVHGNGSSTLWIGPGFNGATYRVCCRPSESVWIVPGTVTE